MVTSNISHHYDSQDRSIMMNHDSDFLAENSSRNLSPSAGPRDHLHPHWQQFEEALYGHHVAVGAVMVVILLLAFLSNITTIIVILRYPSLQTPGNALVLNLALSDLLMAMTGFPLYIISSFYGHWPFSKQVCEFYGFAGGAFGLMSINTLAAIAIDRYLVIVRPTAGSTSKMQQTLWMILCIWILSIGWAIPPLFGWNRYTWEGYGTTCSYDYLTKTRRSQSFIWTMFFGGFVSPMMVIIYCYITIYIKVLDHKRKFIEFTSMTHTKVMRGSREYKHNVHVKTAIAACWCVVLFCLSWTPYAVLSLLGLLTDGQRIVPILPVLAGILAKAGTIYNPIFYAILHPRFRLKLKSCICGKDNYFRSRKGPVLYRKSDERTIDDVKVSNKSSGKRKHHPRQVLVDLQMKPKSEHYELCGIRNNGSPKLCVLKYSFANNV